jgi:hypothetical protein
MRQPVLRHHVTGKVGGRKRAWCANRYSFARSGRPHGLGPRPQLVKPCTALRARSRLDSCDALAVSCYPTAFGTYGNPRRYSGQKKKKQIIDQYAIPSKRRLAPAPRAPADAILCSLAR